MSGKVNQRRYFFPHVLWSSALWDLLENPIANIFLIKSTWGSPNALGQMIPDLSFNIENAQLRRGTWTEHYRWFPCNVWSHSLPTYIELSFQEAWMWHRHSNNGQEQIFSLGARKEERRKGIYHIGYNNINIWVSLIKSKSSNILDI